MTLKRKLIAFGVLLVLVAGPTVVWVARSGADQAALEKQASELVDDTLRGSGLDPSTMQQEKRTEFCQPGIFGRDERSVRVIRTIGRAPDATAIESLRKIKAYWVSQPPC